MGEHSVVCIEYADLCGPTPEAVDKDILRAYGPGGLGILFVRGVPGMAQAREELLPLARDVALLPEQTLAAYENESAFYCIGWSRGREKFKGKPDLSKGSFYANPLHDDPADGDENVRLPAFPSFHPRVCPQSDRRAGRTALSILSPHRSAVAVPRRAGAAGVPLHCTELLARRSAAA
jgi:hypothetical protein